MWLECIQKNRTCHHPTEWDWQKVENSFVPIWSELSNASAACKELIRCGGKKSCYRRCTCHL